MKPYPIVIKYSDFTVNTRSPRPVACQTSYHKIHPWSGNSQRCQHQKLRSTKLWLHSRQTKIDSTKFYTLSDNPTHTDIAETDTSRYHFAPLYEDVFIFWENKDPELIKESKLELFCALATGWLIFGPKTFTWDNCPAKAATRFQGNLTLFDEALDKKLNKGLRSVKLDYDKGRFERYFPNDCLTAQFSTYQLRLTVTPKSPSVMDTPKAMWMYFDILVHSIDLEWGDVALLPKNRNDIDPVYKNTWQRCYCFWSEGCRAWRKSPFGFLKNYRQRWSRRKPAPGKKHKVILTSNLFTVKKTTDSQNFEPEILQISVNIKNCGDFIRRIPLIAKVSIKTSDNKI